MKHVQTLDEMQFYELRKLLERAEEQADIARYADSLTPKRLADERVSEIKQALARKERARRNAT